ncbi:putative damage-inducible protein DinB [Algoriphagus sp. 4150]|uniref:DinB family protein n=1 Tax=Algoriphagus sp. 4150 TaxID=2817756 RepID=UPI0028592CEA|nr:DinB family protein [Algoriphagus sp. 4150]MDR7131326.1 putative damage-inducible protein DinB [Algoriphagus sp. 4150]
MNSIELILLNFSEIRRRSIKLWNGIPDEYLNWKPDEKAFTVIEMIRHVLEGEHLFHRIVELRGNLGDYQSPWVELKYSDLKNELEFSGKYWVEFLGMINGLNESDLENITIERKEVGQNKKLGDYLNRIAYHEAVHTGQMLGYLRTIGIELPNIWD